MSAFTYLNLVHGKIKERKLISHNNGALRPYTAHAGAWAAASQCSLYTLM